MNIPPTKTLDELKEIYEECGGDLTKVAERLGLSIADLAQQVSPAATPAPRRRKPPTDLGKESMRKHIVSIRHAEVPVWPAADLNKIEKARDSYCAGTHEMTQGRDRDWFILYLIPRKRRVPARPFFRVVGE